MKRLNTATVFVLILFSNCLQAHAQLPDRIQTKAGLLSIEKSPEGKERLLLNNQKLLEDYFLWFEWKGSIQTEDVIVLGTSGGGNACPAIYRFLILKPSGTIRISRQFGTCSEEPRITQTPQRVRLKIPSARLDPDLIVIYEKGQITVGGKRIGFEITLPKEQRLVLGTPYPQLKRYLGKHPFQTFKDKAIQNKFRILLKNDFDHFVDNLTVSTDTEIIDKYYIGQGQARHSGGMEEAMFCIDISTERIYAAFLAEEDKVFYLGGNSLQELPLPLREWIERHASANVIKK